MLKKYKPSVKEMIEVMQHYIDGGTVEFYNGEEWISVALPSFDWGKKLYRIKKKKWLEIGVIYQDDIEYIDEEND